MPGPYIHMSSARHVGRALAEKGYRPTRTERTDPNWTGADPQTLGALVAKFPNFANIGAVGPDLFFFLPDFRDSHGVSISSVLVKVLEFLEGAFEAVDPFISKWEQYLGPISEDQAETLSRLTGGLSESVGNISGELSGILITLLEDFFTQQKDWWEFFSLGLNQGFDDKAYFWSDMLHYRSTGQFGRALLDKANEANDDSLRAYALGYNSHIATDVTGHALVNTISGGPFRLHWQRHHLVENHADAFWYLADDDPSAPNMITGYKQLTESALYFDIAFDEHDMSMPARPAFPGGHTLRDNWTRGRLLDIDSELPDPIAKLLRAAIDQVFYAGGGPHPQILVDDNGRPSEDLIKEAYRLFFRYLKIVSVDGFSHEPPPPPDVFPNLDFPTLSDPAGDSAPGSSDSDSVWDDILDVLLAIIAVIAYIAEVAVYLATLPWAIAADVTTYPLRLGLYYALELPLFHMLKNFRAVLVLTGYLMPMEDEIVPSLIQIGNTAASTFNDLVNMMGDVFGGLLPAADPVSDQTFRDREYPRAHLPDEFRSPWNYPSTAKVEGPHTTAGPHARRETPTTLFQGAAGNANLRSNFEAAATPAAADNLGQQLTPTHHLGDSVDFSKYVIWLSSRDAKQKNGQAVPVTDWNLDADRGYGYHCWDWNRRPIDGANPAQPDPEGNLFAQPCTWPSQSDPSLDPKADFHADVDVKVHWVPGADPGCGNGGNGGDNGPPPPK